MLVLAKFYTYKKIERASYKLMNARGQSVLIRSWAPWICVLILMKMYTYWSNYQLYVSNINRLVLACHYDSKYTREYDFIGAIDSAVPCAMLLHLAHTLQRQLTTHKNTPGQNVTLQFIFFDGEEAFVEWNQLDSIYGSRHLAEKWENTPYALNGNQRTNYLDRMVRWNVQILTFKYNYWIDWGWKK